MRLRCYAFLCAKDDAAGQAIANRFEAQTTGLAQAQRNANDGISVAQTAEGALDQVNDNVQRVRELSVQAQNGTNSEQDLSSIQDEIGQRLDEIDRISGQTDFNGVKVLDKDNNLSIQVGANDGETIDIDLEKIDSGSLGLDSFNVGGPQGSTNEVDASAAQEIFGDTTEITSAAVETSANFNSAAVQGKFGLSNTPDSAKTNVVTDENDNWFVQTDVKIGSANTDDIEKMESLGYEATGAKGNEFTINIAVDPQDMEGDDATVKYTEGSSKLEFAVGLADYSQDEITGAATSKPLGTLDDALSKIDNLRSDLGAIQNRFDSAINNLSTNETNLSDAQSRIEDADYASEVADMTKNQILQQAGTSVLAQANQLPQNALSLLG